ELHLVELHVALRREDLVAPPDALAGLARRRVGSGRGWMQRLHLAAVGAGTPEELEVPRGRDVAIESGHAIVEGLLPLPLVQAIRGQYAKAHLDEHAKRAQGHPRAMEELGVLLGIAVDQLARGGDEAKSRRLGGDIAERAPRAMGAGGDRPRDALPVDVPHVRHGHAIRAEQGPETMHGGRAAWWGLPSQAGANPAARSTGSPPRRPASERSTPSEAQRGTKEWPVAA